MSVKIPPIAEGTRVRVRRAHVPQDPGVTGRLGTVVTSSEYSTHNIAVILDGDPEVHRFHPAELEPVSVPALAADRESAKQRRALP